MNIGIIGLFVNDINGKSGSFLCGISHGFISSGLFILVGLLYNRYHTKSILYYRGLVLILPIFTL